MAVGKQEYSARTLGATWGIISAVMVPIVIVLICIGWRLLLRKKAEDKEESEFMNIKTRPLDPEESYKTDDESIPYKNQESPEPVKVVDEPQTSFPYNQPYDQTQELPPPPPVPETIPETRKWQGETEIN